MESFNKSIKITIVHPAEVMEFMPDAWKQNMTSSMMKMLYYLLMFFVSTVVDVLINGTIQISNIF